MDLATHVIGVTSFLWVRTVDGVWRDTLALQEFHGFVQFLAMTVGPKDDAVPVSLQHFQRLNRERHGLANSGIPVFHHGAIKIYCDEQALFHHP